MLEPREMVSLFLEKPSKYLFINRRGEGHFYATFNDWEDYEFGENPFLDRGISDASQWCCFDARSSSHMADIRGKVILAHPELDFPYANIGITSKWNAFAKKNGLWDEYVEAFLDRHLFEIADFYFVNDLADKPAGKAQYRKLRKALEKYESYEFELEIADDHLFTVISEYGHMSFVVLGNARGTYGISFYLGDDDSQQYCAIACGEEMNPDRDTFLTRTCGSLADTVALYLEKRPGEAAVAPEENPFGEDNRYSFLTVHNGKVTGLRLTSFMAESLIKRVEVAIKALKDYLQDDPELDPPCPVNVSIFMHGKKTAIHSTDLDEEYFHDYGDTMGDCLLRSVPTPRYPHRGKKDETWSFVFRLAPRVFGDDEENIYKYQRYVGFVCDDRSGKVLHSLLVWINDETDFPTALRSAAEKEFADSIVPKTIYVNQYFDEAIANFVFAPLISAGSEIVLVDEELPSDEASCYFADKMMNDAWQDNLPKA